MPSAVDIAQGYNEVPAPERIASPLMRADGSKAYSNPVDETIRAAGGFEQSLYASKYAQMLSDYSDSTKYQRAAADLKAAGLNPRLLLGNGYDTTASHASSGFSASSSQSQSQSQSTSFAGSAVLAALILAAVKLMMA